MLGQLREAVTTTTLLQAIYTASTVELFVCNCDTMPGFNPG
jgi:hypothetical protein